MEKLILKTIMIVLKIGRKNISYCHEVDDSRIVAKYEDLLA